MAWKLRNQKSGISGQESDIRDQKVAVRGQVMVVFATPFLDITMRGVGIAKAVVEFFSRNISALFEVKTSNLIGSVFECLARFRYCRYRPGRLKR